MTVRVEKSSAVAESAAAKKRSLDAVFRPRSIAVIGASRERGTLGGEIFHNLISKNFNGPVYPVNPKSAVVQSVMAYPDISAVPGDVDLAVIVVPAVHVLTTLEACGRKGVRAAVIISAGFKETGSEGEARERALVECARSYDIRLVGPNCLGVLNTEPTVRMDATFSPIHPPAGKVAFSSQSGALGLAILEYATTLNIGISQFASVGNKADVSGSDLLEFWEDDPGTSVILLYLESFGNPRRFIPIAQRIGHKKPIIAVKSGRTAAGVRAAASHTGSLAGTDAAVDALCRKTGVIRTNTIEELFDVAILLAHQPVPRGNRVGILTNAGGPAIMASDACESNGLLVPALHPDTVAALREFLPSEASLRNPVDMIASATPAAFDRAVRLMLEDPNLDSLLAIFVPPMPKDALYVAQAILKAARETRERLSSTGVAPKPVLTCFMGSHGVPEGLRSLQEGHVPSYTFPESAAIALSHAVRYGRWRQAAEGARPRFADIDVARGEAIVKAAAARAGDGPAWLEPDEVRRLLGAYGLRTPETRLAHSADEAEAAAREVGMPVVVKLVSPTITHKSEVGGVVLDLRTEEEVRRAYTGIVERLRAVGRESEMDGVMIQPMVREGVEAIIGVTQDRKFGPLIMFGLGGVYVELLKDVVFRLNPLTDLEAKDMVREVKGYRLLEGWRGNPAGDVAALEEALLRVSRLLEDRPEIAEMDLNPLKVLPPGQGCVVVDARVAVCRGEC